MAAVQASGERSLSVRDVRNLLRDAVLRTELRPGTVQSQDEVRLSLDVGRTPFREALRMVQAEGYIEILPNGRLKIPGLSVQDFVQIQIARIALECAAVRLSVPQLGPDDLARLEGFMGQMSHYLTTDYLNRIETPHREFHQGLVAAAGPVILKQINDLSDRASRYRWAFSDHLKGYWPIRTTEHRAILDAAIAGDGEEVAARLAAHYLDASLLLAEAMDDPEGREQLEPVMLGSLPPEVRSLVEEFKPRSGRAPSEPA